MIEETKSEGTARENITEEVIRNISKLLLLASRQEQEYISSGKKATRKLKLCNSEENTEESPVLVREIMNQITDKLEKLKQTKSNEGEIDSLKRALLFTSASKPAIEKSGERSAGLENSQDGHYKSDKLPLEILKDSILVSLIRFSRVYKDIADLVIMLSKAEIIEDDGEGIILDKKEGLKLNLYNEENEHILAESKTTQFLSKLYKIIKWPISIEEALKGVDIDKTNADNDSLFLKLVKTEPRVFENFGLDKNEQVLQLLFGAATDSGIELTTKNRISGKDVIELVEAQGDLELASKLKVIFQQMKDSEEAKPDYLDLDSFRIDEDRVESAYESIEGGTMLLSSSQSESTEAANDEINQGSSLLGQGAGAGAGEG